MESPTAVSNPAPAAPAAAPSSAPSAAAPSGGALPQPTSAPAAPAASYEQPADIGAWLAANNIAPEAQQGVEAQAPEQPSGYEYAPDPVIDAQKEALENPDNLAGEQSADAAAEVDEFADLDSLSDDDFIQRLQERRERLEAANKQTLTPEEITDERVRATVTELQQKVEANAPMVEFAQALTQHFTDAGFESAQPFLDTVGHLLSPTETVTVNGQEVDRGLLAAHSIAQQFPNLAGDLLALDLNREDGFLRQNLDTVIDALKKTPEFNEQFLPRTEADKFINTELQEKLLGLSAQFEGPLKDAYEKMSVAEQLEILDLAKDNKWNVADRLLEASAQKRQAAEQVKQAEQAKQQKQVAERTRQAQQMLQRDTNQMFGKWVTDAKAAGFSELEAKGLAAEAYLAFDANTFAPNSKESQLFNEMQSALASGNKDAYRKAVQEYQKQGLTYFAPAVRKAVQAQRAGKATTATKPATAPSTSSLVTPPANQQPQFEAPQNGSGKPLDYMSPEEYWRGMQQQYARR